MKPLSNSILSSPAEIIEFMNEGIQNSICLQPFACLPNHIVGKGVIKTIRAKFPEANKNLIEALTQEKFSRYIWKKVITVTLG